MRPDLADAPISAITPKIVEKSSKSRRPDALAPHNGGPDGTQLRPSTSNYAGVLESTLVELIAKAEAIEMAEDRNCSRSHGSNRSRKIPRAPASAFHPKRAEIGKIKVIDASCLKLQDDALETSLPHHPPPYHALRHRLRHSYKVEEIRENLPPASAPPRRTQQILIDEAC